MYSWSSVAWQVLHCWLFGSIPHECYDRLTLSAACARLFRYYRQRFLKNWALGYRQTSCCANDAQPRSRRSEVAPTPKPAAAFISGASRSAFEIAVGQHNRRSTNHNLLHQPDQVQSESPTARPPRPSWQSKLTIEGMRCCRKSELSWRKLLILSHGSCDRAVIVTRTTTFANAFTSASRAASTATRFTNTASAANAVI